MPAKNHIHKYKRLNVAKRMEKPRYVWACGFSDCTHFQPVAKLLVGKESICWKCLEKYILGTDILIRHPRMKPTCPNCRLKSKAKTHKEVKEIESLDRAIDMLAQMRGDLE